jgi:hypothetical protein
MKLYAVHLASGKTYCKNNYLFLSSWKVKVILISIPPPLFWPILKNLNEGIGVELGWKHMMWVVGDESTWCEWSVMEAHDVSGRWWKHMWVVGDGSTWCEWSVMEARCEWSVFLFLQYFFRITFLIYICICNWKSNWKYLWVMGSKIAITLL